MSMLDDFRGTFYDLVLKKSCNLNLKSFDCYLELSEEGKKLTLMTFMGQNAPCFKSLIRSCHSYLRSNNLTIDPKNQQIIIARKFDFSSMCPEKFALTLLQFHSEISKHRQDIDLEDKDFALA